MKSFLLLWMLVLAVDAKSLWGSDDGDSSKRTGSSFRDPKTTERKLQSSEDESNKEVEKKEEVDEENDGERRTSLFKRKKHGSDDASEDEKEEKKKKKKKEEKEEEKEEVISVDEEEKKDKKKAKKEEKEEVVSASEDEGKKKAKKEEVVSASEDEGKKKEKKEENEEVVVSDDGDEKEDEFSKLRFVAFGTSRTYGAGLENRKSQAYPFLLSHNATNLGKRASGPDYPSLCTFSLIGPKLFDVIILEFYQDNSEKIVRLAKRLRQRFPNAFIVFVRLWIPSRYRLKKAPDGEKSMKNWAKAKGFPDHTTPEFKKFLMDETEPDDWELHEKKSYSENVIAAAKEVDGHVVSLPAPGDAHEAIEKYGHFFLSDMIHFSPVGHSYVAQLIRNDLHDKAFYERNNQVEPWDEHDQCDDWHETGTTKMETSMEMVEYSNGKFALEVPTGGGWIKLLNPMKDDAQVFVNYLVTGPEKKYPKAHFVIKRALNKPKSILHEIQVDPVLPDVQVPMHVTETSEVGTIKGRGRPVMVIEVLEKDTEYPLRITGVAVAARESSDDEDNEDENKEKSKGESNDEESITVRNAKQKGSDDEDEKIEIEDKGSKKRKTAEEDGEKIEVDNDEKEKKKSRKLADDDEEDVGNKKRKTTEEDGEKVEADNDEDDKKKSRKLADDDDEEDGGNKKRKVTEEDGEKVEADNDEDGKKKSRKIAKDDDEEDKGSKKRKTTEEDGEEIEADNDEKQSRKLVKGDDEEDGGNKKRKATEEDGEKIEADDDGEKKSRKLAGDGDDEEAKTPTKVSIDEDDEESSSKKKKKKASEDDADSTVKDDEEEGPSKKKKDTDEDEVSVDDDEENSSKKKKKKGSSGDEDEVKVKSSRNLRGSDN